MIKRSAVSVVALAFASLASAATAQPSGTGAALERNFDSLISSAEQMSWLEQMSSAPNHVGSPHEPQVRQGLTHPAPTA